MDLFIELFKDELPTGFILFLVLLFLVLNSTSLKEWQKISLLYILIGLYILYGKSSLMIAILVFLASSFFVIEIFTDDTEKIKLFNWRYKIIDYFFKMFIEYYLFTFLFSIYAIFLANSFVMSCTISLIKNPLCAYPIMNNVVMFLFFVSIFILTCAILSISRQKFSTNTISHIVAILNKEKFFTNRDIRNDSKYKMITSFEDRTFFFRDPKSHTIFNWNNLIIFLKRAGALTILRRPVRSAKLFFSRGYGTIDMQLVRILGIRNGYDTCLIRRKIFEILYSNMIFNSYFRYFRKFDDGKISFKYWIIRNYIKNVPVRIGIESYPANNEILSEFCSKKILRNSLWRSYSYGVLV